MSKLSLLNIPKLMEGGALCNTDERDAKNGVWESKLLP